jgi:hypothetical protein
VDDDASVESQVRQEEAREEEMTHVIGADL